MTLSHQWSVVEAHHCLALHQRLLPGGLLLREQRLRRRQPLRAARLRRRFLLLDPRHALGVGGLPKGMHGVSNLWDVEVN